MNTQQLTLLPALVPPSTSGFVYYGTDMCNIKIGYSTNPRRRGGELKIQQLLSFDGGELEERRHQKMWRKYQIGSSEWFHAAPEVLLWLALRIDPSTRARVVLDQLAHSVLRQSAA